ncbi:MAG: hypothetical protein JJU28_05640 [Cyclobacteriaceae bacterium]|nr:hypothetical protein [Cyclobacteriaceae bacterium]
MTAKNIWIKLTKWEFWPTCIVYIPVAIYYTWLALKSRSCFFFSLANPGMEMGGLYGASKFKQLCQLSDLHKPKTIFCAAGTVPEQLTEALRKFDINFPLILKPDCGERGKGVVLIRNNDDLARQPTLQSNCVIQEYIDYPFEAGVFYYRLPGEKKGHIPSIVLKEFLSVTGDGKSRIIELADKNNRALLVRKQLLKSLGSSVDEVLNAGEVKILESIGNHNRGTKFLDGRHLINSELEQMFTDISAQLAGFYYGRYDLRASSLEDFLQGRNIKILEVNGVNAEPAHIYDPGIRLLTGIGTLLRHWNIIYSISKLNRISGCTTPTFKDAVTHYKNWKLSVKKQ